MSDAVFSEITDLFDPAPARPDVNPRDLWRILPVRDLMKKAGAPPSDWEAVLGYELADPWWDAFPYLKGDERIDVPALFVNSWYDFGVAETLFEFNFFKQHAVSGRARENQFVIISPMTHCRSEVASESTVVGEREMGDARLDYWNIYLRWFDYWLRGIDSGVTDMPKVQYYVMGRNEWASSEAWPLPETRFTKYYLHSNGRANSGRGTGTLSMGVPASEPSDAFVYDPATPVPSRGGPVCCTGTPDAPEGSFDQSDVEMRHDVLVYSTPPLDQGIEVTGPLEVVLYVSSSARDTDFTAKLVDVYPDGRAFNVQEGILRARYREGFDKKVWMEPDEVLRGSHRSAGYQQLLRVGPPDTSRGLEQQFPTLRPEPEYRRQQLRRNRMAGGEKCDPPQSRLCIPYRSPGDTLGFSLGQLPLPDWNLAGGTYHRAGGERPGQVPRVRPTHCERGASLRCAAPQSVRRRERDDALVSSPLRRVQASRSHFSRPLTKRRKRSPIEGTSRQRPGTVSSIDGSRVSTGWSALSPAGLLVAAVAKRFPRAPGAFLSCSARSWKVGSRRRAPFTPRVRKSTLAARPSSLG